MPRRTIVTRGGLGRTAGALLLTLGALGSVFFIQTPFRGFAVRPLNAAEDPEFPEEDEDSDSQTVRLNFFNATWPDILRKVAQKTGSDLVMTRAPAGRWTRRDFQKYSRTDAVRLLNHELEPKGFRIIEEGRYLVVLHLDTFRTRYARPVVPRAGQEPVSTVENKAADRPAHDRAQPQEPQQNVIRTAGHELEVSADPSPVAHDLDQVLEEHRCASEHTRKSISVPTQRKGAKNVARFIHNALAERSEIIPAGPDGLPAFRVFEEPRAVNRKKPAQRSDSRSPPPQFEVGIDTESDRLVVDAPRETQQVVADLIRLLDAKTVPPGHKVRLLSSPRHSARDTEAVRQALTKIVSAGKSEKKSSSPGSLVPVSQEVPQENEPESTESETEPPLPRDPQGPGDGQPLVRLEGLRGPVTIQDVPGIGMVVTGNQDDVDAVMRIIRELERVATNAEANIHLLLLRHVNSEALAGLLNDVYQELTSVRSGGATQSRLASIIPVVRPNALLILAGENELSAILELAETLDQPVDPRSQFEVFSLKNAVASDVAESLSTLYAQQQQQQGQQQNTGLQVRVEVIADPRTNSVIVQAAPNDLARIATLIRKIDRDSSSAVSRMRVFPLKNAVADELAEVINSAIQSVLNPARATGGQAGGGQFAGPGGAGQGAQQIQQVKSIVVELLTNDGEAEKLLRSGLLADIRVTADVRVNSLIVTAPEQSMPLLAELIRTLDRPSSNVAEIKVFALKNSDAAALAQLLENLFSPDGAQGELGIQVAGAEDASSGLIPMRFSVDTRTNSIIAVGGAEALRVVEAILLRLDDTGVRQRRTIVFKLKNSPAAEVAVAINEFLQSQRDLAQIDPELVSNMELLEQEIIVVPELVSNSLLISATPRYYDEILEIVNRLDEAPAQVVIQVLIVEVDLQNTDEFGIELGFQDSVLFDRGLLENVQTITTSTSNPATGVVTTTEQIINQELVPGFLFNNQQLGNNAVHPSAVGTQGLSNFSLGRINGDLGFGGLVLSASSEAVSVLVRALAAQRNVQILSRPQIRTVDNQLAVIQVGQQVPVISGVTTNQFGGVSPVLGQPQQVGIILQVTPRITPDGIIVMETIANKSAISGQGVPILTDATTGAVVESPIFDLTEARSTVSVPDGQTIVLGGMITKSDNTLERKVPWLGDIPLLGMAFRYDSTSTRRTELLIFMTPRIIRNAADSELIKQVETERLHFLVEEAEEIHGPLFAVPPENPLDPSFMQEPPPLLVPEVPGSIEAMSPESFEGVPTTIMPVDPGDASYRPVTVFDESESDVTRLKPALESAEKQPPAERKRWSNKLPRFSPK